MYKMLYQPTPGRGSDLLKQSNRTLYPAEYKAIVHLTLCFHNENGSEIARMNFMANDYIASVSNWKKRMPSRYSGFFGSFKMLYQGLQDETAMPIGINYQQFNSWKTQHMAQVIICENDSWKFAGLYIDTTQI